MKKFVFFLALALLVLQSFSQDTSKHVLSKAAYLKKSRSQNTAGWILLGAGLGMLGASVATYKVDIDLSGLFGGTPSGSQVDNTTSTFLGIAGTAAVIASIINFTSASGNRRKAAAITFSNQRIPVLHQNVMTAKLQPAIGVLVPL